MVAIITTVPGKKDRNDVLLQELVASKNWKQALNHCEKRLKKGETAERLLLNKASILLQTGDKSKENEGIAELRKLLDRKPPVTDGEVLFAVEDVCNGASALGHNVSDLADSIWERAAKESPKDESLLELWFETKFAQRNYKAAQKAAIIYSAKFKGQRKSFYWAIVALHLASTASAVSQAERHLFANLSHRLLTDAIELARKPEEGPSNVDANLNPQQASIKKRGATNSRAIQSPNDLQLLVEVYRYQGRYEDALSILNDPDIGISSKIGQSSWELLRERILLYQLCDSWDELWHSCFELLIRAGPDGDSSHELTHNIDAGIFGDDWVVWAALIKASSHIRTQENSKQTRAIILSYLNNGRKSRNSRLAMIEFCISDLALSDHSDLLSALLAYYYDYSASPMCFQDLRCAYDLPLSQKGEFLTQVARHAGASKYEDNDTESARAIYLTSEINCLKQDYTLIVSVRPSLADKALFEHFISTCLRLYKLSLPLGKSLPASERRPGDDAAILAAMGCVHLYDMGDKRALLRSVVILEVLLSNSGHNYDALLLIIRIYFCLGAVSKGIIHYMKLDIKHIQHLTNSWILFTRISTLHPHPLQGGIAGSNSSISPAVLLRGALSWLDRNDAMVEAGVKKFMRYDSMVNLLKHLNYTTISELGPMIRHQFMIEIQRISRLGHSKPEPRIKFPLKSPDFTIEDARDRSCFPNYEAQGEPCFEEYIQSGPMPGNAWLSHQLLIIDLAQAISGIQPVSPVDLNIVGTDGMTPEEANATFWTRHMATLLSMAVDAQRKDRESFSVAMRGLVDGNHALPWLITATHLSRDPASLAQKFSADLIVPHWRYFHVIYSFMDQCSLTLAWIGTIALINRVNNFFPDQRLLDTEFMKMNAIVTDVYDKFHASASRLRDSLRQPATHKALKAAVLDPTGAESDLVGMELRKLVDGDWMDDLGASMLESWQDGLDGVIRTKKLRN